MLARMQLRMLVDDDEVVAWRGDPSVDVAALVHDSRAVVPGACFACITGATTDGHLYARDAIAAGAVALLVERSLDLGVAEAQVRRVRVALGPAAARLHGHPSRALRCLGVTGTNGKTTTTHLLAAIGTADGQTAGLIGTLGTRIVRPEGAEGIAGFPDAPDVKLRHTTPEADELQSLLAQLRDTGVTMVAMEVSSHALDQHRVDGTWFTATCFTNLSRDHLDYHPTIEDYFEAKAALFDPARTSAAAVNIDDPFGERLAVRAAARGIKVISYGTTELADVSARDLAVEHDSTTFTLLDRVGGRAAEVTTPLLGAVGLANALAAAATALAGGLSWDSVLTGLGAVEVVPGRLERVDAGQPFTVLVDYAHTPDALEKVIDVAHAIARGRVLVVFGCGGDRDRAKRPEMGEVVGRGADLAILTSDNPRSEDPAEIAAAARVGLVRAGGRFVEELDRRTAIRHALQGAEPADIVVIAGKGHESGQLVGDAVLPFDDRAVAREELGALGWS